MNSNAHITLNTFNPNNNLQTFNVTCYHILHALWNFCPIYCMLTHFLYFKVQASLNIILEREVLVMLFGGRDNMADGGTVWQVLQCSAVVGNDARQMD